MSFTESPKAQQASAIHEMICEHPNARLWIFAMALDVQRRIRVLFAAAFGGDDRRNHLLRMIFRRLAKQRP